MTLHLAEIATEIAPGKHAVLLLDQGEDGALIHLSRETGEVESPMGGRASTNAGFPLTPARSRKRGYRIFTKPM